MNNYDFHHLDHVKQQSTSKKTLWITLMLTLFFTIVEVVGGILSNSLALLSDSAHMISDVFALVLSMTAIYMSTRKPNRKYTFGFLRFEIIASFLNGLALAIIALGIFVEGIRRIVQPKDVDLTTMLIIASIGLIVNVVLTIILSRSAKKENNLNVKSALWHFFGDLLSSVGIIVSGILIYFTGYSILDPLISMIIGGIIFVGGSKIIRESYLILMETVPNNFDLDAIRRDIKELDGIEDVHELHLWSVTSEHYSLTAHVFTKKNIEPFIVIKAINNVLKNKYGIEHSTIQIEHPDYNDHGEYGRKFLLNHA